VDEEQAAILALQLRDLRYELENIKVLRGGWDRWQELSYPMEK